MSDQLFAAELELALARNRDAYAALAGEILILRASVCDLRLAVDELSASNDEYALLVEENREFLNLLCISVGPLAENIRRCAVEAGYSRQEAEVILAYATQVNCAAAALGPALCRLDKAIKMGKFLSFVLGLGVGIGVGAAIAGAASATATATATTAAGSASPWTAAAAATTVTATATATASAGALPFLLGGGLIGLGLIGGVAGRGRAGCATCVPGGVCIPCRPDDKDRPTQLIPIPQLERKMEDSDATSTFIGRNSARRNADRLITPPARRRPEVRVGG